MSTKSLSAVALAVALGAGVGLAGGPAQATPSGPGTLHGYCAGAGQCIDNGTNSPTSTNPPSNFGFTVSPGPETGTLFVDILVPNNAPAGPNFSITGTASGTASLFNSTAWTSGQLDSYLGISASPANPIGAYLPSTNTLVPSATGFFVYQANLGTLTLQGPSNPNVSPLENLGSSLPLGSYIVGFLRIGDLYGATANSGAIFETSPPPPPSVPEPASLALLGTALALVGFGARRRRS